MNGIEIRKKIDDLSEFIANSLTPSFFVLNNEVREAQEKIKYLQSICPHEYREDGFCIYCRKRSGK